MRQFLCYPDAKAYTIPELESRLQFKCLKQIAFESDLERQEILRRGMEQWKNQGVREHSLIMGAKYFNEIEGSYLPNVSIRWINENLGYGLFAEEQLEAESYIGEYTGIVRKYDRRNANHYTYEYPVLDDTGKSYVIDATSGYLTRFINHSFSPNLKPVYAFYQGFYHVIFISMHTIEKGTQLSFNYGYNYWYTRGQPEKL